MTECMDTMILQGHFRCKTVSSLIEEIPTDTHVNKIQ